MKNDYLLYDIRTITKVLILERKELEALELFVGGYKYLKRNKIIRQNLITKRQTIKLLKDLIKTKQRQLSYTKVRPL